MLAGLLVGSVRAKTLSAAASGAASEVTHQPLADPVEEAPIPRTLIALLNDTFLKYTGERQAHE